MKRALPVLALLVFVSCSDDPPPDDAVPLPVQPQISANLLFVTFDLTQEGGSGVADIVLSNGGQENLVLEAPYLEGSGAAAFSLAQPESLTVPSRSAVSVRVTFSPPTRGVYYGELVVPSNAQNAEELGGELRIELFGPARSASAGLDTPDIGLADPSASVALPAGVTAGAVFVRIFNIGRASLFLTDYELTDNSSGFFALDTTGLIPGATCSETVRCAEGFFCAEGTCALSVPSGAFQIVGVAYAPTAPGSHNVTLRVSSNDPDQSIVTVPITGTR